jgi:hypothetical protein
MLAAGTYEYTISGTGYRPESGTVTVIANELTTIDGSLERLAGATGTAATPATPSAEVPNAPAVVAMGKLRLRVDPPDADISIDGNTVGRGVLVDHELPVGSRRLRLAASAFVTFDTLLTVRPGETISLGRRTLQPSVP